MSRNKILQNKISKKSEAGPPICLSSKNIADPISNEHE
jgi:hypothetical protein